MSDQFLRYLEREHARLEAAIAAEQKRPAPDTGEVARLEKAKLLVKDQLARWHQDIAGAVFA